MAESDDVVLSMLREERRSCGETIAQNLKFIQQGTTFWTSAISVLAGFGWKSNLPQLLLLVPFPIFFIIFHGIFCAREIAVRGAEAGVIEKVINDRVGRKVLIWESDLASTFIHQSNLIAPIIGLLGSFLLVSGSLYHVIHISDNAPFNANQAICRKSAEVEIVACLLLTIYAFINIIRTFGVFGMKGIYSVAKTKTELLLGTGLSKTKLDLSGAAFSTGAPAEASAGAVAPAALVPASAPRVESGEINAIETITNKEAEESDSGISHDAEDDDSG